MANSERLTWRGIRFYRYPDSAHRADRVYWSPSIAGRLAGVRRLHEMIWEAEHGPIPDGHHVHHVDHDPMNNDIGNLALLTKAEHHRHHRAEQDAAGTSPTFGAAALAAAAEWHRSPEGLAWHKAHGARTWDNRVATERSCERCGDPYESRSLKGTEKYCSPRCRAAARRASGVDDENRNCAHCGATFRCNRYMKTRFCSRRCGATKR